MRAVIPFLNNRYLANNLWSEMDRFFDDASPSLGLATEVKETDEQYQLSIDLPGLKKEDISIEFADRILTISGERKSKSFGQFKKTFSLPNTVNIEKIQARYENGVLELTLPKSEKALSRKIEIQ